MLGLLGRASHELAPHAAVVGEEPQQSQGSLLALSLSGGREIARAEGGAGFSATPSVDGELGGALSNGGRFLFLRIN